ncbi:uncharacterized protein P174DRAFT_418372 [Aspergillus novofumigatus IBT 16806]|uniref:Uncharacterized protein n=1 Tax=Aspergillus novofumigatus (strain IBT 16806) TaxID=1392255 RepID=A0A2I1CIE9_ASPN1|nr:uncharacterized protein P174DRAFT_418372 [Aspergillus novofumigatus IBT 16806]PKX97399.1 hypothetical protein P174DRAFT_418372 [Aspergillus novofumigatus IBT 16806]
MFKAQTWCPYGPDSPIEGYTIVLMEWTGKPHTDKQEVTFKGTIQEVMSRILDVNLGSSPVSAKTTSASVPATSRKETRSVVPSALPLMAGKSRRRLESRSL